MTERSVSGDFGEQKIGFLDRVKRRIGQKCGRTALAACVVLAGCSSEPKWSEPRTDLPPLLVRSGTPAAEWMKTHPEDDEIRVIAEQPTALWLHGDNPATFKALENNIAEGLQQNRTPTFVIYNIPERDCGGYSDGGADSLEAYKEWIDKVRDIIGDNPAVTIIEPDGLLQTDSAECQALFAAEPSLREERIAAIQYAIIQLNTKDNNAYIDAGTAGWGTPDAAAGLLQEVHVEAADGIALNVSNYYPTEQTTERARAISEALGHSIHIVIDTSRNGETSIAYDGTWCNPSDRALGENPKFIFKKRQGVTTDALLWVKDPAKSDGTCNDGKPAGQADWKKARILVQNR